MLMNGRLIPEKDFSDIQGEYQKIGVKNLNHLLKKENSMQ